MSTPDAEQNRLSGRLSRYARVGANVGGVAARVAASRLLNRKGDDASNAKALTEALGGLKGPIMKVAQLLATIPDALPPEYAEELQRLQSEAPPMGWAFVKRRMQTELGAGWEGRFGSFEKTPAAAASLGQVHRAVTTAGASVAVKLQYPDMQSAVEADLNQLQVLFALHRQMDKAIDTREIFKEIGARVREELDYGHEARNARLYADVLSDVPLVRVPGVHADLSTKRLLTLDWLSGNKMLTYKGASQEDRNRIAQAMFTAWWLPFSRFGVIHGDPHLGNYTVFEEDGAPGGINLLDYGCIRLFPTRFIGGVVDLYMGLLTNDAARLVHAYETWGFRNLSKDVIEVLNIWARFIYGPILDDRVRTIADGVSPGEYGRKEAFRVHQELKQKGPVTVPQEFVFMDRAAIGLGGVFLHLEARLNFYQLFNTAIENFSLETVARRQSEALTKVGLPIPA
jgi:predicted unusual protein kinase regulating ubiquinone biosynthesis (AarF/ABC1/UbiB family)